MPWRIAGIGLSWRIFWRRANHRRRRFVLPLSRAVGVLGDATNVALLAERAARTSGEEQAAARASLRVLQGKDVHAEMIGAVKGGDAAIQVELILALADRRATEATPVLLQMAASQEASVRTASYRALGELAGAGEGEALVALLAKAAGENSRSWRTRFCAWPGGRTPRPRSRKRSWRNSIRSGTRGSRVR